MSDQQPIYVEKWVTFTLRDGAWDMATWANGFRPLVGKVYRIKVAVPAELVGAEIVAEVVSDG